MVISIAFKFLSIVSSRKARNWKRVPQARKETVSIALKVTTS